jgi:DNA-binding Xre family transcriptional regulator
MKSNLEKLMKARKMTIKTLEKLSNVNNVTISKARKDDEISRCTLATLAKIAEALEVSVHELFDDNLSLSEKPLADDTIATRFENIENRIKAIESKLQLLSS